MSQGGGLTGRRKSPGSTLPAMLASKGPTNRLVCFLPLQAGRDRGPPQQLLAEWRAS